MWLMFLLGVLAGAIILLVIACIVGSKIESKERKEKKGFKDKADTIAGILYRASWNLGYIQGKHDAKAGIDELPDVAYKRLNEADEKKEEA